MLKAFSIICHCFLISTLLAQTATLEKTFELREINNIKIPYQNGMPVPSFEKQDRTTLNLEGIWKKKRFSADHDISLTARDNEGYMNLINESPNYHLSNFDDSVWEDFKIPSVEYTMNEYPTVPEYYEDGVWYRMKFTVHDSLSAKFAKLMFHSVNYVADIWINGEYLGWHEGGYTPFAFNATPHLIFDGENSIAIRVDNPPWGSRKDIVPFYRCDWFNYTGIIQDVYLEFSNQTSVIRADIIPDGSEGKFDTKIVVHNASELEKSLTAKIDIYDTEINATNIKSELAN
jgi:beta-glucuronidase